VPQEWEDALTADAVPQHFVCDAVEARVPVRDRFAILQTMLGKDGADSRDDVRVAYARMAFTDFALRLQDPAGGVVYSAEELATCPRVDIIMTPEEADETVAAGGGERIEDTTTVFDTTAAAKLAQTTVAVRTTVRRTPAWFPAALDRVFAARLRVTLDAENRIGPFLPAVYADAVLIGVAVQFVRQAQIVLATLSERAMWDLAGRTWSAFSRGTQTVEGIRSARAEHQHITRVFLETTQNLVLCAMSPCLTADDAALNALREPCARLAPSMLDPLDPTGARTLPVVVGGVTEEAMLAGHDDGAYHVNEERASEIRRVGEMLAATDAGAVGAPDDRAAREAASQWCAANAEQLGFLPWDIEARHFPYLIHLYWTTAVKTRNPPEDFVSSLKTILVNATKSLATCLPSTQRCKLLEDAVAKNRAETQARAKASHGRADEAEDDVAAKRARDDAVAEVD
jgi:hypothetical protein